MTRSDSTTKWPAHQSLVNLFLCQLDLLYLEFHNLCSVYPRYYYKYVPDRYIKGDYIIVDALADWEGARKACKQMGDGFDMAIGFNEREVEFLQVILTEAQIDTQFVHMGFSRLKTHFFDTVLAIVLMVYCLFLIPLISFSQFELHSFCWLETKEFVDLVRSWKNLDKTS